MADLRPLQVLPQPRKVVELTPEAKNFKAFKAKWKQKEVNRVVRLAFCPKSPYNLAVVSGTKVGIWQEKKASAAENVSTISKFKDLTQCVSWRDDGKLLLAGEAGGSCAVVEVQTKKVLRRFRGHGDAVTCAAFATADRSRAVTGCRDGRFRVWDVATCQLLQTVEAHSDCMKVVTSGPGGPDAWITAGYDRCVKLWDLRAVEGGGAGACVASMDHGHPVEDGVAYPGGAMFASAGGPAVKVWDLAAGGRQVLGQDDMHSKTVTSVCLNSEASVMLTASFDGFAKAFRAADLQHYWTYRLSGPITCAAWRPDDRAFAVGLDDGQWQLRLRLTEEDQLELSAAAAAAAGAPQKSRAKREGHLRGMDSLPAEDDELVGMDRRKKGRRDSEVDYHFRKFEYRKVLEYMLDPKTTYPAGLAVVDELLQRGALGKAMANLSEDLCAKTLTWLLKAFSTGDKLQHTLFEEALHTLLDNNRCLQPPRTAQLVEALTRLENKVNNEMLQQEALMEAGGMLKSIIAV